MAHTAQQSDAPRENSAPTAVSDPERRAEWSCPGVLGIAGVLTVVLAVVVLGTTLPLGVPGEWVWQRWPTVDVPTIELVCIAVGCALAGALAFLVDRRSTDRAVRAIAFACLLCVGGWLDFQVLLAGRLGLTASVYAVLDEHSTGYLTEAASITDAKEYFTRFGERLGRQDGGVTHVEVHPPGNIMLAYVALDACRRWPRAAQAMLERMPYDVHEGLQQARQLKYFGDLLDDDPAVYPAACLMVLGYLVGLSAARALLCLAVWLTTQRRGVSALVVCLLLGVPSPVLFLGHADVFYFTWSSLCVALYALSRHGRQSRRWAALVSLGIACGIGVVCTIGYALLITLFVFLFMVRGTREKEAWTELVVFLAGGGLVIVVCYAFGLRIVEVCLQCMDNNTQFYLDTLLTWRWHLVNPVDFAVFIGLPWSCVALLNVQRCRLRTVLACDANEQLRTFGWLLFAYLMLHPTLRAELARVSLLYMPVALMLCGMDVAERVRSRRDWWLLLGAAGVGVVQVCILRIALKLTFFHGNA